MVTAAGGLSLDTPGPSRRKNSRNVVDMNVASVIRNRDHQANAESGYFSGLTQNVVTHSRRSILGGRVLSRWSGRTNANSNIAPMAKMDGTTNRITMWCWNS